MNDARGSWGNFYPDSETVLIDNDCPKIFHLYPVAIVSQSFPEWEILEAKDVDNNRSIEQFV